MNLLVVNVKIKKFKLLYFYNNYYYYCYILPCVLASVSCQLLELKLLLNQRRIAQKLEIVQRKFVIGAQVRLKLDA